MTAIRRANEDLNDSTIADGGWTPLLGTPPYPSHGSNLTCIGASAARALARVLGGDAMQFSVKWTGSAGNDNVTRSYDKLSDLADEGARSRVYGGIHFNFELTAAHESCHQVADYVVKNFAQRKKP
jgi:hypothetical protein